MELLAWLQPCDQFDAALKPPRKHGFRQGYHNLASQAGNNLVTTWLQDGCTLVFTIIMVLAD